MISATICKMLAFPADIWQMTSDLNWLLQISCALKFNSFKRGKTSFSLLRDFSFDFTRFIYDFFNGFGSWPKSPWPLWLFGVWKGPVTRDCWIDRNGTVTPDSGIESQNSAVLSPGSGIVSQKWDVPYQCQNGGLWGEETGFLHLSGGHFTHHNAVTFLRKVFQIQINTTLFVRFSWITSAGNR